MNEGEWFVYVFQGQDLPPCLHFSSVHTQKFCSWNITCAKLCQHLPLLHDQSDPDSKEIDQSAYSTQTGYDPVGLSRSSGDAKPAQIMGKFELANC